MLISKCNWVINRKCILCFVHSKKKTKNCIDSMQHLEFESNNLKYACMYECVYSEKVLSAFSAELACVIKI